MWQAPHSEPGSIYYFILFQAIYHPSWIGVSYIVHIGTIFLELSLKGVFFKVFLIKYTWEPSISEPSDKGVLFTCFLYSTPWPLSWNRDILIGTHCKVLNVSDSNPISCCSCEPSNDPHLAEFYKNVQLWMITVKVSCVHLWCVCHVFFHGRRGCSRESSNTRT